MPTLDAKVTAQKNVGRLDQVAARELQRGSLEMELAVKRERRKMASDFGADGAETPRKESPN